LINLLISTDAVQLPLLLIAVTLNLFPVALSNSKIVEKMLEFVSLIVALKVIFLSLEVKLLPLLGEVITTEGTVLSTMKLTLTVLFLLPLVSLAITVTVCLPSDKTETL